MSDNSQVVYLSEHKSKMHPLKATSAGNAGLPLTEGKREKLQSIRLQLIEACENQHELLVYSAALASSIVQACQRAGYRTAPWHFAQFYERMMREDGTSPP